jgi:hypothetical protein
MLMHTAKEVERNPTTGEHRARTALFGASVTVDLVGSFDAESRRVSDTHSNLFVPSS